MDTKLAVVVIIVLLIIIIWSRRASTPVPITKNNTLELLKAKPDWAYTDAKTKKTIAIGFRDISADQLTLSMNVEGFAPTRVNWQAVDGERLVLWEPKANKANDFIELRAQAGKLHIYEKEAGKESFNQVLE